MYYVVVKYLKCDDSLCLSFNSKKARDGFLIFHNDFFDTPDGLAHYEAISASDALKRFPDFNDYGDRCIHVHRHLDSASTPFHISFHLSEILARC